MEKKIFLFVKNWNFLFWENNLHFVKVEKKDKEINQFRLNKKIMFIFDY